MSSSDNDKCKRRIHSSLPEIYALPPPRKFRSSSGDETFLKISDHRRESLDTMKFHILCRMASLAVRSRNARDKNATSAFGSYAKRRATRVDSLGRHSKRSDSRGDSINALREKVQHSEIAEKRIFSEQETRYLIRKFRMWVRIHVVLAKMQKYYSIDRTDYKNMQFSNLEAIYPDDLVDVNKDNFIFDVSEYKANRQMRMSHEAKRIMTKPSEERTDEEINYAMVAIRSVKQISDYPVMMQRNLAKYGLFLSFEQKRVLIRQDHKPEGFYFLLFGTVAVIVRNKENGICRIVCYLCRGDNFGELAIVNKSIRQSTVVTKSYVEVLVITEEIYEKVFMAGGAKSLKDPDHNEFIRSLYFLQDWPVYLMEENPKLFLFSYFKRNDVMVKDSCYSDWIYIVKSGAITVLKKLVKVNPDINRKQARYKHVMEEDHLTSFTSHTAEFNRYIDSKGLRLPPPLSVSSDEDDDDDESCFDELEAVERINTPSLQKLEKEIRDLRRPQTAYPAFYTGHNQALLFDDTKRPPKSAASKGHSYSAAGKGRLSKRVKMTPNSTWEQGGLENSNEEEETFRPQKRTYVDDLDSAYRPKEKVISQADVNPEFVKVGVMTKGEVFGLSQMLYPGQPSLCVVSNGADCLMLNKKFYLEHCSPNMLARLRNQTSPFPSETSFQTNLERRVNWDSYKTAVVENFVKSSQKLRARSALPRMKFK